ncbi:hypothetical protein F6R98_20935 [Candidatus Methylospira mobilis]|uniref:Uncharacterized protein n=1 Tax=Candidatus Methylospira mobilis TaxID=1808979 RepID=A0A5Q0BM01_9GAMM|nr:hypothetical protein [Candidatus Methylospira mobilis]QFY44790.1 hypothetical protein F6R98_20935 [Candidatus Methylospira mobilis]WNV05669.1 hypothetical protein RP726_04420 [Candidatus Methylospira mobilis]
MHERRFFKTALLAGCLLVTLPLLLVQLAFQGKASVFPNDPDPLALPTPHINLQPASENPLQQKSLRSLRLTAEDITAIANFLLMKKELAGRIETRIKEKHLEFRAAIKLPTQQKNIYLNIALIADDDTPHAIIRRLDIGHLVIPEPLVYVLMKAVRLFPSIKHYDDLATRIVQGVHIGSDQVSITLHWNNSTTGQAQELESDLANRDRLLSYHNRLAELIAQSGKKRFISLGSLMQPLFQLAKARTETAAASLGDPVEENRALILVLTAYANGWSLLTDNGTLPAPEPLPRLGTLLNRRVDTAQHFMLSATLAMSGNRTLSDMIGFAKEINDIHSGSGFSFTDLAADRAGTLFGKMATRSPKDALTTQNKISQTREETIYMPRILDLPEHLSSYAFQTRFHSVESAEFQEIKQLIEDRVNACPLYK